MAEEVGGEIRVKIETSDVGRSEEGILGGGPGPSSLGKTDSFWGAPLSKRLWSTVTTFLPALAGAAGIGALIKESKIISSMLEGTFEILGAMVDLVLMPLTPLLTKLLQLLALIIPPIASVMNEVVKDLGKAGEKIGELAFNLYDKVFKPMGEFLGVFTYLAWASFLNLTNMVGDGIKFIFNDIPKAIGDSIHTFLWGLPKEAKAVWDIIKDTGIAMWDTVLTWLHKIFPFIPGPPDRNEEPPQGFKGPWTFPNGRFPWEIVSGSSTVSATFNIYSTGVVDAENVKSVVKKYFEEEMGKVLRERYA